MIEIRGLHDHDGQPFAVINAAEGEDWFLTPTDAVRHAREEVGFALVIADEKHGKTRYFPARMGEDATPHVKENTGYNALSPALEQITNEEDGKR